MKTPTKGTKGKIRRNRTRRGGAKRNVCAEAVPSLGAAALRARRDQARIPRRSVQLNRAEI